MVARLSLYAVLLVRKIHRNEIFIYSYGISNKPNDRNDRALW